jgi:hypothetical protein
VREGDKRIGGTGREEDRGWLLVQDARTEVLARETHQVWWHGQPVGGSHRGDGRLLREEAAALREEEVGVRLAGEEEREEE